MILLPVGHEQESTRRLPWVTFGVMAVCLVAFLATGRGTTDPVANQEKLEAALDYFMSHPYLTLSDEAEQAFFTGMGPQKLEAFREGLRSSLDRPEADRIAREQAELDRLCTAVFGSVEDPLHRWGLKPSDRSLPTWITHMFLHAGWLHLLGNMFLLFLTGPFLEDVWGRPLYGALYALFGLAAAGAFVARYAELSDPMVGASGAIAGLMGAFLVRYWNTRVCFFYAMGLSIRGTFWAPAWLVLGLWIANQLFLATMADGGMGDGSGGVAYLAHVGGFAAGALAAFGLRVGKVEERWLASSIEARTQTTVVSNTELDGALEAYASGNVGEALASLADQARRSPDDPDVALAFWQVASDAACPARAVPGMLRVIARELRAGSADAAADHWLELVARAPAARLDAATLVRLAPALAARGHRDHAAQALRRALLEGGSTLAPPLLLRIGALARELDPALARGAASLVLSHAQLEPAERRQAETLLAAVQPVAVSGG